MGPAHSKQIKDIERVQRRAARFVENEYSITPGTIMIILNDLKWPTFEKRRKVTRLTMMFKVVSSLSAIQFPPYILFKTRPGIRQFHPKTFIQRMELLYQIVSLKSSQKSVWKRPLCAIFNLRFCRPWKRFTYLLLTQTWPELNFQWFLIPLLARHLNASCFPNSYTGHLQLYPRTVHEWKQHQPESEFG